MPPRALPAALALALAAAVAVVDCAADEALYDVTDEEYYQMPPLFQLDEYEGCLATRGVYCLGSFDLAAPDHHQLFRFMKRYSANWVRNFNHTRLHRGVCLTRSCAHFEPQATAPATAGRHALETWFTTCVNATITAAYNLSARPRSVEYCERGPRPDAPALDANERAFAGFVATLLALAAVSTVLDLTLPDHARKGLEWALAWSLRGSWGALQAPPPRSADTDLRAFDGLRVFCMMCVIVEHVCWLLTQSYLADTKEYEEMRGATDVILMVNSTLVVQIFFLMSTFLLAHKVLRERRRDPPPRALATIADTMFNRIIRVSPSYFFVVWFAGSWWARAGGGPLWGPAVGGEAAVCRRKWWAHLLYLNNVLDADSKCLIQTWYLAADMQLYALALALTVLLARWRRGALAALAALLAAAVALLFALAYQWHLMPTYFMHNPELVRVSYSGESSFNVLYQSPLSNSPGALTGLLLAHAHHALLTAGVRLERSKVFRWVSIVSPLLSVWWVAVSPLLLGRGAGRGARAALAALERPVFSLLVALGLLGAMHNVKSPLRSLLSWRGWAAPARLSFGALLLHLPLNKALVARRLVPSQLNRQIAIFEWFGMAMVSYLAALPLALLLELPAQRLHRALAAARRGAGPRDRAASAAAALHEKTDM